MHERPTHWTLRTIVRNGIGMPQAPPPYRLSRAIWGVAIYLIGFLILLFVVSKYYLIPAFVAEQGATPSNAASLSPIPGSFSRWCFSCCLWVCS